MIDVGTLVMKVAADTSKFTSGIGKVTKLVGGIAKAAAVAGLAAGAGLAAIGKQAIDLAQEQEQAEARLESIGKKVAGATDLQIESLKELAAETQKYTTFGDEVIIAGQSQILSFGATAEQTEALTGSLVDMLAATKGTTATQEDAINAANILGKALDGQAGSLSRVGILLNEEQEALIKNGTQAERAAALVDILESNYGGLAETLAKTSAGQMQQVKNALGDIGERIGFMLLPKLNDFLKWVTSNMPKIESFLTKAMDNGVKAFDYAANFVDTKLIPIFNKISDWWAINGEAVGTKSKEIFDKVVANAKIMWDFFTVHIMPMLSDFVGFVMERVPPIFDVMKRVFDGIMKVVKPVWNIFEKVLYPAIKLVVNYAMDHLESLLDITTTVFEAMLSPIQSVVEVISGIVDWFDKLFGKMDDYSNKDIKAPKVETPLGFDDGLPELGTNTYTPGILTAQQLSGSNESVTPMTSNSRSKAGDVNITISNPSFSNKRDVDRTMNLMVGRLKLEGVNP